MNIKSIRNKSELTDEFLWNFYESESELVFNILENVPNFSVEIVFDSLRIYNKKYKELLHIDEKLSRSYFWFFYSNVNKLFTSINKDINYNKFDWIIYCQ